MIAGVLTLQLIYPQVHSLKEKRSIIQSLFTRLKKRFNIAVCEVSAQDLWQRSEVGIVSINSSTQELERTMDYVVNFIRNENDLELIDIRLELI